LIANDLLQSNLVTAAIMVQGPTTSVSKPAIVIVPGSFSPASFYTDVVDALQASGFEAIVETLPSSARSPLRQEKAATMEEDAAFFHDIAEKLADEGKDVVIVTHSYGGIPGTECSKGLSKAERQAASKTGGISRLVYVTSVVPAPGKSLKDLMGDLVPSSIKFEVSTITSILTDAGRMVDCRDRASSCTMSSKRAPRLRFRICPLR